MARAPDVRPLRFEFHDAAARAFAALLELPAAPAIVHLELSQATEHRALPARDAALRDPRGYLPHSLGQRVSTQIRQTLTWDPGRELFVVEGFLDDYATALPPRERPGYGFASPYVPVTALEQAPGWRPWLERLLQRGPASAVLDAATEAQLELHTARLESIEHVAGLLRFGPRVR